MQELIFSRMLLTHERLSALHGFIAGRRENVLHPIHELYQIFPSVPETPSGIGSCAILFTANSHNSRGGKRNGRLIPEGLLVDRLVTARKVYSLLSNGNPVDELKNYYSSELHLALFQTAISSSEKFIPILPLTSDSNENI
jgi:hypothetical protein